MSVLVSAATKRNWERLGVVDYSKRLTKRANKTESIRKFIPLECLKNISASSVIEIVNMVKAESTSVETIIFSLAHKLVSSIHNDIGKKWFFEKYKHCKLNSSIRLLDLPNEQDILGILYQSLLTEGQKNKTGSYYTPAKIVSVMTKAFSFDKGQTFLDPACGSGAFLMSLDCPNPAQIYGIDNDPIAVMIARANLLIKYDKREFIPNIYGFDALENSTISDSKCIRNVKGKKFDYIATNPPWGAVGRSKDDKRNFFSNELFSCFLHNALQKLNPDGMLSFLLPISFLNVKSHSKIREYVVRNYSITQIVNFPNVFSNVTTEFVVLNIKNSPPTSKYTFFDKNRKLILKRHYLESGEYVFYIHKPTYMLYERR